MDSTETLFETPVFGLSLPPLISEFSESLLSQRGAREEVEATAEGSAREATLTDCDGGVVGVVAVELGAPNVGSSFDVDEVTGTRSWKTVTAYLRISILNTW